MKKIVAGVVLVLAMVSGVQAASTCTSCCPTPVVLLCKTFTGRIIRCSQASNATFAAGALGQYEQGIEAQSVANVCCAPQQLFICKLRGGFIQDCRQL